MGDLLDIYKTDKETKLKSSEDELLKSRSQIAQLMQEKVIWPSVLNLIIHNLIIPLLYLSLLNVLLWVTFHRKTSQTTFVYKNCMRKESD